jgi:hypothetical protein
VAHAIFAALWLLGLYAAAPLLRGAATAYTVVDRVRDALLLGIALPLLLGTLHLLYPIALVAALAFCVAFAILRRDRDAFAARAPVAQRRPPYLAITAVLIVAWPQLMRPILDSDSLSYHLPNAAAWVQAHSLWTTATRYWWYPPASESFAAGLYAVAGPFALPWCGVCALMLLAMRVARWTSETLGDWGGDALAAALVTAFPLAIAAATLQNDVWLAAFFVESLWTLQRPDRSAGARTLAATSLFKPQGWIFAVVAMVCARAPRRVWIGATAAVVAWFVRDALLLRGALAATERSAAYVHPFATAILAHGSQGLLQLVQITASLSPFALVAMTAALCGPLLSTSRSLGWAACASALLFLVLPFGYETYVPQLATGASLRFAAPAIAAGTLVLAAPLRRIAGIVVVACGASAIFGIWRIVALFWNDGSTRAAIPLALAGVAAVTWTYRRRTPWPAVAATFCGIVLSTQLAARHPIDFYNDALRVYGIRPGIYRYIADAQPSAIGGVGLRLGVVNVLAPGIFTRDLLDDGACDSARRSHLLLVAVAQSDIPPRMNEARLAMARACIPVAYSDAIGIASASASPRPRATAGRRSTAIVF